MGTFLRLFSDVEMFMEARYQHILYAGTIKLKYFFDLFEMPECSHEQPMTTCAFTHTSLERLYLLLYDNE